MHGRPLIWVLTDDRAGNVAQALGVAEALARNHGLSFTAKPIAYNPLAHLPNALTGASLIGLAPMIRAALTPPWPDLVIATGRRTAPVARWIKRNARKNVILVQVMNPGRRGAEDFDLIAIPSHDDEGPGGDAPNVMRIVGAPHRFTAEGFAAAANVWRWRIGALPRPYVVLIVGGATRRRPFPSVLVRDLGERTARMAAAAGGSVLFTSSRRTGREAEAALGDTLTGPHYSFLWAEGGENPYVGFLALADAIVVTGDSVSMCAEACATTAPVYIYAPDGMVAAKHARLHRHLYDGGFARPFDGRLERWTHPPLNPADEIAQKIDTLIRRTLG